MAQNRNGKHRRPRTSPLVADGSIVVNDPSLVRAKLSRTFSEYPRSLNPPPHRSISTPPQLRPRSPHLRHSSPLGFPPPRPPRSALRGSQVLPVPTAASNSAFCSSPTRHRASSSVPSLPNEYLASNTFDQVPRLARLALVTEHIVLPASSKNHKRHKSLTTARQSRSFACSPSSLSTVCDGGIERARTARSEGGRLLKDSVVDALVYDTSSVLSPKNNSLDKFGMISGARSTIKLHRLGEILPLTATRDSHSKELLPNRQSHYSIPESPKYMDLELLSCRQSLFSIPGSPNYMDLEFNLITDGENAGDIVLSPRSENSFPTGKKSMLSITVPSVPVDVDLETPFSPMFSRPFPEQSTRNFKTKSRTFSTGFGAPRRKQSLKQQKSIASLKAHKRGVSKADSVLFATNPIEKHTRDASFLSFTSDGSDDHELFSETGEALEASGSGLERTLSHKRSIDTLSIDSEDLREAEELITDILSLPVPIDPSARLNTVTMKGRYLTMPPLSVPKIAKTRSSHPDPIASPPPITELPPPPASFSNLVVSRLFSGSRTGTVVPEVPIPISSRGRTSENETLYHSPTAGVSIPRASYSTDDYNDTESSSSRSATPMRAPCSKAPDILGIDTDEIARKTDETVVSASVKPANMGQGSISRESGFLGIPGEPPQRKRSPSTKALEVLGLYGDPDMVHEATPPDLTTRTVNKKRGGVKKLWKTLTGASVKER